MWGAVHTMAEPRAQSAVRGTRCNIRQVSSSQVLSPQRRLSLVWRARLKGTGIRPGPSEPRRHSPGTFLTGSLRQNHYTYAHTHKNGPDVNQFGAGRLKLHVKIIGNEIKWDENIVTPKIDSILPRVTF